MRLRQLLEPYFLFNHEWRGLASRQAGFHESKDGFRGALYSL